MATYVGTKLPLSAAHIKAIQDDLYAKAEWRDLALFMAGIDSLLRSCDILQLRVSDVREDRGSIRSRIAIKQQKTGRTVEFHLSKPTRQAINYWLKTSDKSARDFCFTGYAPNCSGSTPLSSSAYRMLIKKWVTAIGLDPARYSTKTLRKSRVRPILEAAGLDYQVPQILLGHADLRSTIHYAGIATDAALAISAQVQMFDLKAFPSAGAVQS